MATSNSSSSRRVIVLVGCCGYRYEPRLNRARREDNERFDSLCSFLRSFACSVVRSLHPSFSSSAASSVMSTTECVFMLYIDESKGEILLYRSMYIVMMCRFYEYRVTVALLCLHPMLLPTLLLQLLLLLLLYIKYEATAALTESVRRRVR